MCKAGLRQVAHMQDIFEELRDMRYLNWTKTRKSSGTAGSFLKAYDDTGIVRRYYKLSDYVTGRGIDGHECINEIIVQRLMRVLDIDHLEYRLLHATVVVDDAEYETWLCESDDFKNQGESKIALEDFFAAQRLAGETPLDMCIRMGWESTIYNMLILDYLILNRDRHGANIEVLRSKKNRNYRLAPLFDHGLCLMCQSRSEAEFKSFDVMDDKRVQAFIGTNSTKDNLSLIPKDYIREFVSSHEITEELRKMLCNKISDIMPLVFCEKTWEMRSGRWKDLESI